MTTAGTRLGVIGGTFDRSAPALGTDNESLLKRAAGPQIAPVYGTDFRSVPTFFIQDDHDYYDNDDAYDEIITFPPDFFMRQMARATQSMYYPEFLPDRTRPAGLPGPNGESFGTLRYGKLAGSNPWGAVGLEWTTSSPPPTENFAETPIVTWEPYDYQAPAEGHVA